MGLLTRLQPTAPADQQRFSLAALLQQVNYLGNSSPPGLQQTHEQGNTEDPDSSFAGIVNSAYRSGGPVFACIVARQYLFSEARFQWQELKDGRPGKLFGTPGLSLLEKPWPNGTTGELLARAEQDVSLAGNFYLRRHEGVDGVRLWRLRPDYMTIVLGSQMEVDNFADAIDAEVIGYRWKRPDAPAGSGVTLFPEEVAHWSPIPAPLATYTGMSWVTPILRELDSDRDAVQHKGQFFKKAATPNLVVLPDATVDYDEFKAFKDDFVGQHEGAVNAYKTLFLGGGSKIETVGSSMKDMDYAGLQGISETRIAAAALVPPIIAGFSEGLASASYSNYSQARRKFGDHFARPQWRSFAAAVEKFIDRPRSGQAARLWYDDRDIAFLREDMGDEAEIRGKDAATVRALVEAGYDPDAAVAFVQSGNLTELVGKHSGLTSVQLTPPENGQSAEASNGGGSANGTKKASAAAGGSLDDVDGIDPLEMATLLQKLYLATPGKVVVSTEEARNLARKAGLELQAGVPDELQPKEPATPSGTGPE